MVPWYIIIRTSRFLSTNFLKMQKGSSNVRVGVRVRPLSDNEVALESRSVVNYPGKSMIRIGDGSGDKTFTFDDVFDSSLSQNGLYTRKPPPAQLISVSRHIILDVFASTLPLLQSFLGGYNVTVSLFKPLLNKICYTSSNPALIR